MGSGLRLAPGSPYRDLIDRNCERAVTAIAGGEPALDIAREIRDAYTGGTDDFYVPVTKMGRQVMPWRKEQDDRRMLEQVEPAFEWWVKGEKEPPGK